MQLAYSIVILIIVVSAVTAAPRLSGLNPQGYYQDEFMKNGVEGKSFKLCNENFILWTLQWKYVYSLIFAIICWALQWKYFEISYESILFVDLCNENILFSELSNENILFVELYNENILFSELFIELCHEKYFILWMK